MESPEEFSIKWTDYMKYRAKSRGFELSKIEIYYGILERGALTPQLTV